MIGIRIKRGVTWVSRSAAGREFEDTIKRVLVAEGWRVLPSNGRPVDVLASLNGFKLLIEAKSYEDVNISTSQGLFIWKRGLRFPFNSASLLRAMRNTTHDKAIIVTTATVNGHEYKGKYNDIEVINYPYFKEWIHTFTGRVLEVSQLRPIQA